jgi:Protein of unknown function (DUF3108)
MAPKFPLQVSITVKIFAKTLTLLIGAVLATHSFSVTAAEKQADFKSLSSYSAQYKTTARGMALKLTRNLKKSPDGSYTLTNGGKIMVVGFHEVSVFGIEGTQVRPKSYVYQGTGLINRRREVHFTPGSDVIRSLYKEQWYELPYTEGTLDRMSQQEQLRLFLLNDPTPAEDIKIRVADGKRIKDYLLSYVGEDTIDTPMGSLQTLHFERIHDDPDRTSDIWVAPELEYLMVKTVHVEDDKPVEVIITKAKIGD